MNLNKTMITRGDILMNTTNGEQYRLVRTGGPKATTAGNMYAFNLENVATGKMRVTDDTRILLHNNELSVPLAALRRHFGLNLVFLTTTATIAPSLKKAVAAEVAPSRQEVSVWRQLGVLPRYGYGYGFALAM